MNLRSLQYIGIIFPVKKAVISVLLLEWRVFLYSYKRLMFILAPGFADTIDFNFKII